VDFQELGREGMNWIVLAEDGGHAVVCCEYDKEHAASIKCWDFLE